MVKVALLVGVSDYSSGLTPLPGAVKDVEALQRVLQHPQIGGFDDVKTLINPEPLAMQEAIQTLFLENRTKDDLILFFFSGHGIKDQRGELYFATRITRKTPQGELVKATAVPASFVQDMMSDSRSKREVVILDCCFSGAFGTGWTAKDDGSVDIQAQLGGEGRAILTSSNSTQYSFEQQGSDFSIYTHYLIEGIETGAADLDSDGEILIEELHEYAKNKVQEAAPAMKPEIYAVKEGYKILLFNTPYPDDPKLRYRKEVERCARHGDISIVGRRILDDLADTSGLLPEVTAAIEAEVLKPYRQYQKKLQRYEQALVEAIQREHFPLSQGTRDELKHFQQVLGLRKEDIAPIEAKVEPHIIWVPRNFTKNIPNFASLIKKPKILIGAGISTVLIFILYFLVNVGGISTSELYTRGLNKSNQGDCKGALADYNQALRQDPNYTLALIERAYCRTEVAEYKGAIEDLDKYIRVNSNDSRAHANRGLNHANLGNYELAIADYNKAIEINPKSAPAYNNRGFAYANQGNYEQAISDYNKAIEYNHDPLTFPYRNRGWAYYKQNNYEQAIADLSKAIEIDPNYAVTYYNRGIVRSHQGDRQGAIKDFQKAAELYQKQGQTNDSQDALNQIKKLQESSPTELPTSTTSSTVSPTPTTMTAKELYDRGLDKSNQGDYKRAIEDFNQALQLEPNYILAYYQRGYARAFLEDYKGAIEDYSQYMQHNPNDVDALDNRGYAYYNLGKYEQAIADLNKAIEINSKDAYAHNTRGLAYNEQGKYEQAIADYNKAIELKHDPLSWPYFNRGNGRRSLGQYKEAIEDYNQAIRIDPNNADDAYYNRGLVRADLGDKQGAIADYQKAAELYQKQGKTKDYQETLVKIKELQQ
jgi:tetratricopeptide (TPR) repeat protein